MSKAVLITFAILMLASSSSLRGPISLTKGNYDGVGLVVQSFMDAYTMTTYNMSECLAPSAQSSLDQILAASVGYLILLDFHQVMNMYGEFLTQLASDVKACGFDQVHASLNAGLAVKGRFWYEVNLAANSEKVSKLFNQFAAQVDEKKFVMASSTLGEITSILIPYVPATQTRLSSYHFSQTGYLQWWNGTIVSLSINPKKLGPCARFLQRFANQSVLPVSDISMLLNHNMAGIDHLFGDLANLLTYFQKNYTTNSCQFDNLIDNIMTLRGLSGIETLGARYAAKAIGLSTAFANVKNCQANFNTCGQATGTIIKYMLDWSIN